MERSGDPHDADAAEPLRAAARRAGVSYDTVQGWVSAGLLPEERVGGILVARPRDVTAAREAAHAGGAVPAWRADQTRAGFRLRVLREAAGLSQQRLEAASGVSHEMISRLELGRGWPRARTVRALAAALGVEPARFVAPEPVGLTLLSAGEAASVLGVPEGRARKWVRHGVLPGTKVSGQWRVPAVAVAELERSGRLRGRSRRLDPRYRG